jgi:nicotinate-nucleotide adenylyltransferase
MTRRPALAPRRLAASLGGWLPPRGTRIGLLGGSFNPAHEAHLQIARDALKRLGLDEVWWLVSPQNPLKPAQGMAELDRRIAAAREVASREPRIRVSGLESLLDTVYSAQTLRRLLSLLPERRFVWLMGADNLLQIDRWQDWTQIFHLVPVAVFDRPPYSVKALSSKAARRFSTGRLAERKASSLAETPPPAWVYIHGRKNPLSATGIRAVRPDWPDADFA